MDKIGLRDQPFEVIKHKWPEMWYHMLLTQGVLVTDGTWIV